MRWRYFALARYKDALEVYVTDLEINPFHLLSPGDAMRYGHKFIAPLRGGVFVPTSAAVNQQGG